MNNNKMSIERIADRLDTLASVTPDKSKMSLERIATALEGLTNTTPASGEASLERIADAIEKYEGGGGGSSFAKITVSITNTGEENDVNVMYRKFSFVVDNEWSTQYLITAGAGKTVSKDLYMPLYEGEGIPLRDGNEFTTDSDVLNLATTGGVMWDDENYTFSCTGDGSISITAINQGAQ